MSDPLAMRIKAISSGEVPSPDLLDADFDHERAAVLGSVIDLAFDAVSVSVINEAEAIGSGIDVCEYGEDRAKIQKALGAKTRLKRAWSDGVGDVLRADTENQSLLEEAEALASPVSGITFEPEVFGAYPQLRSLLYRGINTAVEESVNFVWTVPGVTGVSPGDEATAVRNSLDVLRELAGINRMHLGPALVALKGATYILGQHPGEDLATKGMNLGYQRDLFTVDEAGRMILGQDPLDLKVLTSDGKTPRVSYFGPDRIIPLGCPALKIKAFTAAARCVISTFDEHELWPKATPA